MTLIVILILMVGAFIAYVNGANDVSKGIATLAGSGVTSYRSAIIWGAIWTTVGSLAAFAVGRAMLATFGKGLLAPGVVPTLPAAIATILGASLCVGLATRFGLPVSTTHAIVGSIAGVATVAYSVNGMRWQTLVTKVGFPLLLSPFVSLAITGSVLQTWKRMRPSDTDCVCAELVPGSPALAASTLTLEADVGASAPSLSVVVCRGTDREKEHPQSIALTVDGLHWLSSGLTSFARGLNDAPKMVALALAATALSGYAVGFSAWAYMVIALGILGGSLSAGARVTTVLAEKITPMNHREGFIANVITATLVGSGAVFGLPMSTTHVASGAIIGVGLQRDRIINWCTVRNMILAWVVTVPAAGLLGIVAYVGLRGMRLLWNG